LHHVDDSAIPHKWISKKITQLFFKKANECDRIVIVSQYWKDYLKSKGFNNTQVIYNGFDVKRFNYTQKEINDFKQKYDFPNKPIIYIGNCQFGKGAMDVYNALKLLDVNLVTSGWQDIQLPIKNFVLNYSEYILLLAASDVVITMSKFLEGWNRTAHEAMLCKTPVIGSGTGGMEELLLGGQQIICEDFENLPENIDYAIKNASVLAKTGYKYASTFTVERFTDNWLKLISELHK